MKDEMRVFSGSAHRELAEAICADLRIPLSASTTKRFRNDNLYVQLCETVRERDVFIVQPFYPAHVSDHILELAFMMDAARSASARRVTAVIPYYSYSRSDKKDEPHISIAGRLLADLLTAAGAQHVVTMTMHSPQVHGFFSVPTDHLSSMKVLVEYFQSQNLTRACVVTPDLGNIKRATRFARLLQLPVVAISKKRISDTKVVVDGVIGEVAGSHAIIVDDEIAVGSSMIEAVKALRPFGVTQATLVCTHGLFCDEALERLFALPEVDAIVTTDTVPIPQRQAMPKLHVLSIAPVFADAIRRIHAGESMQIHFEY